MGRPKRADDGGLIYHVLKRADARMTIFEKDGDYEAFERILEEAIDRTRTRLQAYCVKPSHWHLIVWPHQEGELTRFIGWLTLTHTQRWDAHRHTRGSGHVYQGRLRSFLGSRATSTFTPPAATLSTTLCGRTWSSERKTGAGAPWTVRNCRLPGYIMAVGLAAGASRELGEAGERRADGGRAGSPTSLGPSWLPVRGAVVVGSDGAAPRPGDDASSQGPAQEVTQRFPTLFHPSLFLEMGGTHPSMRRCALSSPARDVL